ncbi:DNA-binding protein SMUBP-2 [Porphyridium purpureum]|uniref:DNA helicase n=1 Tax=Porphyridium purpureum TaxID=35688 RepID=A0A5J4YXQ0_PORPP|nr:DNA-binding protein SMUBP-2 [Porphyridium purpureum]|eukprot:POR4914..scf209_3
MDGVERVRRCRDADEYVGWMQGLLEVERDEEVAVMVQAGVSRAQMAQMQAAGDAIMRLELRHERTGFGGKTVWELAGAPARRLLDGAACRMRTGDIVTVRCKHADGGGTGSSLRFHEGVLTELKDESVSVMLNHDPFSHPTKDYTEQASADSETSSSFHYAVLRIGSETTFLKMNAALKQLRALSHSHPASRVRSILFHSEIKPQNGLLGSLPEDARHKMEAILASLALNDPQVDAILAAVDAKDLAVIHGPPGTGKTTCLVALICILVVVLKQRVLVVAPSNIAVDNVTERLGAVLPLVAAAVEDKTSKPKKIIRIGHPARILANAQRFSLEHALAACDESALVRDIRTEIDQIDQSLSASSQRRHPGVAGKSTDKHKLYGERRTLRRELAKTERLALSRTIQSADVVLSTAVGAGSRSVSFATRGMHDGDASHGPGKPFDVVIVDEAGQGLEPSLWIALLQARKAVMAGDPFQLPPTVKSAKAEQGGLAVSVLDRIFENKSLCDQVVRMLTIQFRMHKTIAAWSSAKFYRGELVPHESVESHLLADVLPSSPARTEDENVSEPLVYIDTAGCSCDEMSSSGRTAEDSSSSGRIVSGASTESRFNEGEALVIFRHLNSLLDAGVAGDLIGIISPYAAQVSLVRKKLESDPRARAVEVSTVDGFQGREKEAILISLVRSNENKETGFVKDLRRMNVAVTRAKRHLVVVGDSDTIGNDLPDFIEFLESHSDYRTAALTLDDQSVAAMSMAATKHVKTGNVSHDKQPHGAKSQKSSKLSKSSRAKQSPSACEKDALKPNAERAAEHTADHPDDAALRSFEDEWTQKIGAYASDAKASRPIELACSLNARQRLIIHRVAEGFSNLTHESVGEGPERRLIVGKKKQDCSSETAPQHASPLSTPVSAPEKKLTVGPAEVSEKAEEALSARRPRAMDEAMKSPRSTAKPKPRAAKNKHTASKSEAKDVENDDEDIDMILASLNVKETGKSNVQPSRFAPHVQAAIDNQKTQLADRAGKEKASHRASLKKVLDQKLAEDSANRSRKSTGKKK